jgi:5-formyltetrahydrofolate cyclo-ligase
MPSSEDPKALTRRTVLSILAGLNAETKHDASVRACRLLEQQPVWKEAQSIFFYAPLPNEVDIWPLAQDSLASGKIVALPRFDAATERYVACQVHNALDDIVQGRYGIREPRERCVLVPLNRLDLVLVPGVAFDPRGRRIGRGRGYYDRLLSLAGGLKCGVAFDEQILAGIPTEPHDVMVDCILTPTRWIQP